MMLLSSLDDISVFVCFDIQLSSPDNLSILMCLDARLSSLDDFKYKKDELMGNLERMERELVEKDKEHQEKLYALERKAVVDKDRYYFNVGHHYKRYWLTIYRLVFQIFFKFWRKIAKMAVKE